MASWPTTLPQPTMSGYALQATDATIRTDMESGPARVRRRYTAAPDKVTLRFVFSEEQMAAFRVFWDGDAQQGAAWWWLTVKDGRTVGSVAREVRPTNGAFKSEMIDAVHWSVTFEVEVRSA